MFRWEKKSFSPRKTFAYINLFLVKKHPFFLPSFDHKKFPFTVILETEGIDESRNLYLSLNGNWIPTCYFLWEDFPGYCSLYMEIRESRRIAWKDSLVAVPA